jgi:rhodanese-related sulfurtransferase
MTVKSGKDLLEEARRRITEVSAGDVVPMVERKDPVVLLDVREPNEWNLGHIPGAIHLPRGQLESHIEALVPRDRSIIVYCAAGNRSALAADTLQQMGYARVSSLAGGWRAWIDADGSVED